MARGHAWQRGACAVKGDVYGKGVCVAKGVCMAKGGCMAKEGGGMRGMHAPPSTRYGWSMRGRYASSGMDPCFLFARTTFQNLK